MRDKTSPEVAQALNISAASVQRYAREGVIPFDETPGGHRRFDVDEVRIALKKANAPVKKRKAKVVILTAVPIEFAAVTSHLESSKLGRLDNGTRYFTGAVTGEEVDWTVHVAEIGPGNLTAASEATRFIQAFKPDLLLFVGIAGSLKKDLTQGSVVVANTIDGYQGGKADDEFYARPVVFRTPHALMQLAMQVARTDWSETRPIPFAQVKPIAAGDHLVTSTRSATVDLIKKHYNDAVAVEMESLGMYEAAHRAGLDAVLAVRGISDMVDDKDDANDKKFQPIAAKNAADFAVALLKAIDPRDFGSGPESDPYDSQSQKLLSHLPLNAQTLFSDLVPENETAMSLLRVLSAGRADAKSALRQVFEDELVPEDEPDAGLLWRAVGEYAFAHNLGEDGREAFERAVLAGVAGPSRLLARSALALGADAETAELRDHLIQRAEAACADDLDEQFLALVRACLVEDFDEITVLAEGYGDKSDQLVTLLWVNALWKSDHPEEAFAVASAFMESYPGRAANSSIPLQMARISIALAQEAGVGQETLTAIDRAYGIALDVRDRRRQWGGPSEEAVTLAVQAVALLKDFDALNGLVVEFPKGDANAREAKDQELIITAANAALMGRRADLARDLSTKIDDVAERALVQGSVAELNGQPSSTVAAYFEDAAKNARHAQNDESRQLYRSYIFLASQGSVDVSRFERLDELGEEERELVLAHGEAAQGNDSDAIDRVRKFSSEQARRFLVGLYFKAGRYDHAIDLLRQLARDTSGRQRLAELVQLLIELGRYDEALEEAKSALATMPTENPMAKQFRRDCIELCGRLQDWDGLVDHARLAVGDGWADEGIKWALVGGLHNLRVPEKAKAELERMNLRPRNEQEAGLAVHLLSTDPQREDLVDRLLSVADEFPDSETVRAAVFMKLLAHESGELSENQQEKLSELVEGFVERWPSSRMIKQVKFSDVSELGDMVRQMVEPTADLVRDLGKQVVAGVMPYGIIASIKRQSVVESFVRRQVGAVSIGPPDQMTFDEEVKAAASALDGTVVVDAATVHVLVRTGLDSLHLPSYFTKVMAPMSLLDDAVAAVQSLSLRSTMTMGWDPETQQPFVSEIATQDAERLFVDAEAHLAVVRAFNPRRVDHRVFEVDLKTLLDPIELARGVSNVRIGEDGVSDRVVGGGVSHSLWSDDPALRSVGRSEGLNCFGTLALLAALSSAGKVSADAVATSHLSMMGELFLDVPFDNEVGHRFLQQQEFKGKAVSLLFSRPSLWRRGSYALELFQKCVIRSAERQFEGLEELATGAVLGVMRLTAPDTRSKAVASIVLGAFFRADSDPVLMPILVEAARAAAAIFEFPDPLEVIAETLCTNLDESLEPVQVPGVFLHIFGKLDERDRRTAMNVLLRRK